MFTHNEIWTALDRLAESFSTSPSGLAREAGLDPTSFNRSKRRAVSGKPRWPSTESLSKVLAVVEMSFEDFAALAANTRGQGASVPVIGLAQAGDQGFFDDSGSRISGRRPCCCCAQSKCAARGPRCGENHRR